MFLKRVFQLKYLIKLYFFNIFNFANDLSSNLHRNISQKSIIFYENTEILKSSFLTTNQFKFNGFQSAKFKVFNQFEDEKIMFSEDFIHTS